MAVMGNFLDKYFRMNSVLIDLINMPDGKADRYHLQLYSCVVECLREKGIPIDEKCHWILGASAFLTWITWITYDDAQ